MDEVHIMTKLQGSPYVIQLHGYQELVNYFRLFMDYAQGEIQLFVSVIEIVTLRLELQKVTCM